MLKDLVYNGKALGERCYLCHAKSPVLRWNGERHRMIVTGVCCLLHAMLLLVSTL